MNKKLTNTITKLGLVGALALTGGACDAVEGADFLDEGLVTHRGHGTGDGGIRLNTDRPLASNIPAFDISLAAAGGPRLVSAEAPIPGLLFGTIDIDSLSLTAEGELLADGEGESLSGAELVGAEFGYRTLPTKTGGAGGAAQYYLKIVDYAPMSRGNGAQGHYYEFKIKQAGGSYDSFCKVDDPFALLLVDTNIDLDTLDVSEKIDSMFIACTAGAAGELVDWGYGPADRSLEEYQAGIHAVLADYCGANDPQTEVGTEIYVSWDYEVEDPLPGTLEARWGLEGALCVDTPRKQGAITSCDGTPIPSCDTSTHDPADELLATAVVVGWSPVNP
ncbi:MAG: hypothetical protein H6713_28025 [Myxococcales bacterium]|nr:hypothetical protein [Myxococcales bacterium]